MKNYRLLPISNRLLPISKWLLPIHISGVNALGGLPSGFDLLDGAEDFVHHLGDDGVAVGFEGFGAPL
jgi:hypothetical protein